MTLGVDWLEGEMCIVAILGSSFVIGRWTA
jgi:hypothetical protein